MWSLYVSRTMTFPRSCDEINRGVANALETETFNLKKNLEYILKQ